MGEFTEELMELGADWDSIDYTDSDYDDLPDGKYQAYVEEVSLGRSKGKGRLQLAWTLIVATGNYKGRYIFHYNGMDTPKQREWLKKDLGRCGLDIKNLSDLESHDVLGKLLDVVVEVTLKTSEWNGQTRQNNYINKQVGKEERPPAKQARKPRRPSASAVKDPGDPFSDEKDIHF